MQELVERINSDVGFYVHHHGLGRIDTNDNVRKPHGGYIRLVHNLNPRILDPLHDRLKQETAYTVGGEFQGVAYGFVPTRVQATEKRLRTRQVKRRFRRSAIVSEAYDATVLVNEKTSLASILEDAPEEPAYFASLNFRTNFADSGQRPCRGAQLVLISNEQFVRSLVGYLAHNPHQFIPLIDAVLDAERFPNYNEVVLSQRSEEQRRPRELTFRRFGRKEDKIIPVTG